MPMLRIGGAGTLLQLPIFQLLLLATLVTANLVKDCLDCSSGLRDLRPTQTVGCYGRLLCGFPSEQTRDTTVELWDHDTFTPDDLMNSTTADSNGYFSLRGSTHEITSISPILKIHHLCGGVVTDADGASCHRVLSIAVPKEYVARGKYVKKWYHVGAIDLSRTFANETKSCS